MITGGGGGGTATPAFAFGTAASRPAAAAGNANTGYYATDTGEVTFSNGAAWKNIDSVNSPGSVLTLNGAQGTYLQYNGTNQIIANAGYNQLNGSYTQMTGFLDIASVGGGIHIAEGSNAKQGVATLVAGTVTVANASVTATSRILLTPQDNNTAGALRVSARTAGTSFTITSSNAADTGVVAYQIFEPG